MSQIVKSGLPEILAKHEASLLTEWVKEQVEGLPKGSSLREAELRDQCKGVLELLMEAVRKGDVGDIQGPAWSGLRDVLATLSHGRGLQGYSPSETASFVFSLKKPLFARLRQEFAND